MGKYRFNREQLRFVEDRRGAKGWVKRVLKYFFASIALSVLYYAVFSFFVNTDEERSLLLQNGLIEQEYAGLQERIEVLDNTVKDLQQRDREIYRSIFNAEPPVDPAYGDYDVFEGIDTTRMESVVKNSKMRLEVIAAGAEQVSASLSAIGDRLETLGEGISSIPSIVPVKDFKISQAGASVGKKVNPFYKTVVMHTGMDLVAATGTPVLAAADGTVSAVTQKGKKEGKSVEIDHGNGYVTKYMNLGDILIRKGQQIRQGTVVGRVGLSGMSFAPHLHYEVWKDGAPEDPINYFFADLTPVMFRDMAVVVANTGQSLD